MTIVEKKYCVIYDDQKAIINLFFSDNNSVNTRLNIYGTNDYNDLVDFIYSNNLYEKNKSRINYSTLKQVQKDVEETLFKYDD
jgi:hypothetical protein